jgi:hypothetical protein
MVLKGLSCVPNRSREWRKHRGLGDVCGQGIRSMAARSRRPNCEWPQEVQLPRVAEAAENATSAPPGSDFDPPALVFPFLN